VVFSGNDGAPCVAEDRGFAIPCSRAALVPPKVYADVLKVGLQIPKEIDVPKQDVYLRTSIYDVGSDAAGTLGVPLSETTTTQPTGSK
jgi:hypothetical protein